MTDMPRRTAFVVDRRELPAYAIEFHAPDCPCIPCEQERMEGEIAAAVAIADETPLLDAFCEAGWIALLGILIASAIAFTIDAHGAAHALVALFSWSA